MTIIISLFVCSILSTYLCLRAINKKPKYKIEKLAKFIEIVMWILITWVFMSGFAEQIVKLRWLAIQ